MILQYVLRDVHRDHVLFDGKTVVGLIAFDAIRGDTPMTDLARWVGGFEPFNEDDLWGAAMAGYQQNSPFPQKQPGQTNLEQMGRDIAFATRWISLANWAIWLTIDHRSFPGGPISVAQRISKWVNSCESGQLGGVWKH